MRTDPAATFDHAACTRLIGELLQIRQALLTHEQELARWIGLYKQWRPLLHGTRVDLGEGSDGLRWQAHGTEQDKILFCIRTSPPQDRRPQPLALPFASGRDAWNVSLLLLAEQPGHGLPVARLFRDMRDAPVRFSGSWLAQAGLPMPIQKAESVAVFRLEAVA